jgi:hypothetical protein
VGFGPRERVAAGAAGVPSGMGTISITAFRGRVFQQTAGNPENNQ